MAKRFSNTRKQEIHFRKSLFLFCSLFSFILLFGVLTHFYIQQFPLDEKLKEHLKVPESYQLTIQNPEISFSQGFMPIIGLKVERIEIHEKACIAKRLVIQNALFVLNPWRLLRNQMKLGWIKVGHADFDRPFNCQNQMAQKEINKKVSSTEQNNKPQGVLDQLAKSSLVKNLIDPSKTDQGENGKVLSDKQILNLFSQFGKIRNLNKVSYLFVDSFSYRGMESMDHYLLIKGYLSAKLKNLVQTDIHIKEVTIRDVVLPISSALLHIELNAESFLASLKSLVREGKLNLNIKIENKEKYPTHFDFQIDKIPVSTFSNLFISENNISYLWFNCRGLSQFFWSKAAQSPLEISVCGIDGPYGEIKLNQIQASFTKISRYQADIENLNLDQILKSKRDLYLSGVFSNYGKLSSTLVFENNQYVLSGVIENSEFIFSNNNLRDIQKVTKIPFKFKGHSNEWQAELKGFEVEGGEIQGDVQIQKNADSQSSYGKVSFHKLILSPKIYKLMLNSMPAEFKLYGKFSVLKNKVSSWSALLATPLLETDMYRINNLKIQAQSSENKKSEIQIKASNGNIKSDSKLAQWIHPTTLDAAWNESEKKFKELSFRLLLSEEQVLEWKRVYLMFENGWQLSSEGLLGGNKKITAWIQWDKADQSILKWSYQGLASKGVWEPQSTQIHTWLNNHSEYLKKYNTIHYEISNKESLGKKINEAGKEALQKVKNVLGKKVDFNSENESDLKSEEKNLENLKDEKK